MTFFDMVLALVQGIGTTLALTVYAFVAGALLALPVAAARSSKFRALRIIGAVYIEFVRGIPPIAWLFLLFFGLNQFQLRLDSFTAAAVGLSIIAAAYIAEIYRSGFNAVPAGQLEAAAALSLGGFTAFRYIISPQAFITVLPLAITYFIGLLKDSAIASVIGVQDITTIALGLSKRSLDALTIFLAAGAVYLIISVPIAVFGRWLGQQAAKRWGVKHAK